MNYKIAEKRIKVLLQRQTEKGKKVMPLRKYQNWGIIVDAYIEGYNTGKKVD